MDARTRHELARITEHLPQHLIDNLMMDDPIDTQFDDMNNELSKSKHIDEKAKRAIAAAGKTQKRSQIVNPVAARQIEEWYDKEVKRAIADGRLPKASALEADRFIQERARKLQGR